MSLLEISVLFAIWLFVVACGLFIIAHPVPGNRSGGAIDIRSHAADHPLSEGDRPWPLQAFLAHDFT